MCISFAVVLCVKDKLITLISPTVGNEHHRLTNIDKWDLLNVGDESEGDCQVLCLLDGDGWPSIIPAEGNITQHA